MRVGSPVRALKLLALAAAALSAGGCFFGGGGVSAFEPEARRLGIVMPFVFKSPDKSLDELPRFLADQLTRALFDTKRMRVIDPGRLDAALKEMKLPTGVPLDAGTMATVCTKLRAETAVFGTILSAVRVTETKSRTRDSLAVEIEAKLVLCSTTEVLSGGKAVGRAHVSYRPDKPVPLESLMTAALEDAARPLSIQLVREIQPR